MAHPAYRNVSVRRTLVLCVAVVFLAACSKTVRIPPTDFATASQKSGLYRVTTIDTEILVSRFSITDSTLVIDEFAGDSTGVASEAIAIPLRHVTAVERIESQKKRAMWVGLGVVLGVAALIIGYQVFSDLPEDD